MKHAWPFVRGGPAGSGATTDAGPVTAPSVAWKAQAGARVGGTPLVVDDGVYVGTDAQFHHSVGCVVAIERDTGSRRWMAADDAEEVRGTPGVADGTLYATDSEGQTLALDVADGQRRASTGPTGMALGTAVSSVVVDDTLYADECFAVARSVDDLEQRWLCHRTGTVGGPLAVANGTVYAGGERTSTAAATAGLSAMAAGNDAELASPVVWALDAVDGTARWATAVAGRTRGTAVVDGRVYTATDGRNRQDGPPGTVHAVDAATGETAWTTTLSDAARTTVAVDGCFVCVCTDGGTLVCLDARTGEPRWSQTVAASGPVTSAPTIAADLVYVGSPDGAVLAFDRRTGERRWRWETVAGVDANPAVVDGVCYIADDAGTVYALR